MAAWFPYNIEGHVWEAFAFVQTGQANTAQILFENLYYRGYSCGDYQIALDALTQRGWLEATEGIYQATEKGQAIYRQAEDLTDLYFYQPWDVLGDTEQELVYTLLTQLRDGLKNLTAGG